MNVHNSAINKQKIIFVAALVFLGFALGTYFSQDSRNNNLFFPFLQNKSDKDSQSPKNAIIKIISEESQVIDVVKKSIPSVVSIVASADVPKMERCYKNMENIDPFFQDFFDFKVPSYCQKGTEKQRVGAASGFIVSSDGYVLTNKHVVENDDADYTIFFNIPGQKDEKATAKVVAKDPSNDIAILKIDKKDLPYLEFGDSDALQVGQTAIAIGYALGEFDNTVSKGVVSGLSRSITAGGTLGGRTEQLEGIIQTDAAINPGNSGGPLLDISGNVIGMNVAMAQAQNIGFALPINDVKKVFEDVQRTGKISRPFLGVRYIPIDEEIQKSNSLPYNYGVLVQRGENVRDLAVIPGSPADKSGIVENDIILEMDGVKIDETHSLVAMVAKRRSGETIHLKVYHKGKEQSVSVILEERK